MSDHLFYVGAQDKSGNFSGYVPAKFLTINGKPVVDPMPGGPKTRIPYIYADDKGTVSSDNANPNNYMIVPANFSEEQARDYSDKIATLLDNHDLQSALVKMRSDFRPWGPHDLQRGPQWGIPEGSTVPAFVSGASHYLGFVTGLNEIPLQWVELAGGFFNGGKRDGPYGVSQQNHQNLVKGQSDASMRTPVWLANNFGYGSQGQSSTGQIGDGRGARWISSLRNVDPSNPTQPVGPQKPTGSLGIVTNEPMPDWPFPPPIFGPR